MADRNPDPRDAKMDATDLWREELITDRKIGTLRVMTPITPQGTTDPSRPQLFVGEAQMMTNVGALPINFEIEADSLADAVEKYGDAAREAFERTLSELQDLRRQQASSLVLPGQGGGGFSAGGIPGMGGGGKIQMP
jgi:hypothetical protein